MGSWLLAPHLPFWEELSVPRLQQTCFAVTSGGTRLGPGLSGREEGHDQLSRVPLRLVLLPNLKVTVWFLPRKAPCAVERSRVLRLSAHTPPQAPASALSVTVSIVCHSCALARCPPPLSSCQVCSRAGWPRPPSHRKCVSNRLPLPRPGAPGGGGV